MILGAAGSHLVPGLDNPESLRSWQTANLFHLLHAVVLLALVSVYGHSGSKVLLLAAVAFALGITVFSGSIYLSFLPSVGSTRQFAPAGGVLLMLGWLLLVFHALKPGS